MITSILIDSREPATYHMQDYGAPAIVTALDAGDLWATTDDGHILIIERKTTEDVLASIKDDRLFTQAGKLAEKRSPTHFPYLVIEGYISVDNQGKVITNRGVTGWNHSAVQGALLTVQEMGIPITHCRMGDYANCVKRLGDRKRDEVTIPPARPPKHLGDGAAVLLALPGIGPEMLNRVFQETPTIAQALCRLSDPGVESSVPVATRKRIRKLFGLEDQFISICANGASQEVLQILEEAK